jgi:hypothetical protein
MYVIAYTSPHENRKRFLEEATVLTWTARCIVAVAVVAAYELTHHKKRCIPLHPHGLSDALLLSIISRCPYGTAVQRVC